MADLEKIENAVSEFNKKYGVDFSITKFGEKLGGKADAKAADKLYKTTFAGLYKKAFANFIDLKLGGKFDFAEMIRDFEKGIMIPYRTLRGAEKKIAPMPYGGWRGGEYLKTVSEYLNSQVPSRKSDFAADRYEKGELHLDDMKAHADQLTEGENPSLAQLSTLFCYAEALKEVHANRSFAWQLLHPIQNFAEQRAAGQFEECINKMIGKETVGSGKDKAAEDHAIVRAFASNDVIDQAKKSLKKTIATIETKERAANELKAKKEASETAKTKTKLIVTEAATSENLVQNATKFRKSAVLEKDVLNLNDF